MKVIKSVAKHSIKGFLPGMLFLALQPYAAQAADAFSTGSPWMLGGWGGVRSDLQQNGVSFQAGYTMESASNLAGGYHTSTTARYSDQWAFGLTSIWKNC
ncbi:carbohydrate-selective porin OprB [Klebsiella aerogenes]|nr:carbohydrate-selective porin OprB [Klebsiella aerogenes]